MDNSILYKKFSIGLSLGESISEIDDLLNEYDKWINSIYFSAPLGRKFYSRAKLTEEYDGNEDKLLTVLRHIKEHQIRLELTLNTRDLTDDELASAVLFFRDNGLNPEEIVCLKGYAGFLRRFCPGCEIKYSFNNHDINIQHADDNFDNVVVGKALLREHEKILLLAKRFNITYMLNNGCSFMCSGNCGAQNCRTVFGEDVRINGLDKVYARSSIFPSELLYILVNWEDAADFKFKISNRPWGLQFTRRALKSYISLKDPIEKMNNDKSYLRVFCATVPIAKQVDNLNVDRILEYKKSMKLM